MLVDATPYASLIESLGAHALRAYFIALPMLMLSVTGVWWLARRYAMPHGDSKLPPSAYLLVRLAFGFAVMVAGALLFAELAEQIADADAARRMGELDTLFSITVGNHLSANARQAFAAITHLADTATLTGLTVVVAVMLSAFQRRWLALAYVGAVAGNALLNVALKNIFERTRPIHDTTLFQPHGWSFPSGHSSGAVVAYGMLAYVLVRTWPPVRNHALSSLAVVLAASALAFTIGCSRIFIQVHYATDVLAGFSSGSMWLAMCIISIELTRHYQRRR